MTWLTIARYAVPYALCIALGFGLAWKIQGARVAVLKSDVKAEAQKLVDYKQAQIQAQIEAEKAAEKRRKETADDYQAKLDALGKDHDTYKRCVAAGKCGAVRLPSMPNGSNGGISAPVRPDADRADAIPAAGTVAAEAEVLKDCARTTLQLNQLQLDIEKQIAAR